MMNALSWFHLMKTASVLVTFFLWISTTSLLAQTNRIDSLKQKLASTPELESFEINFQLATENLNSDTKIAYRFGLTAKSLAYVNQDSLNIVRSLRLLGQVHRRLDNLDSSLYYLQKCLPIANKNNFNEEHKIILNSLGVAYIFLSKYDHALSYLMQSLALRERSRDKNGIDRIQNNIGIVYYKLKDYRIALDYFNKSLAIKLDIKDNYDLDMLIVNISLCHAHLGELDEAKLSLQPIIQKCLAKCDDNLFVTTLYTSGVIWLQSDSLNKGEENFLQSYSVAKRSNNQRFIFDDIIYLSQIYLKQGKFTTAEKFLLEGERMTIASHFDLEEMKLYEEFCSLYKAKTNYSKLSIYQKKYIDMKDSVSNNTQTNNLMRLHAEASDKENKAQLASQEKTLQLKDEIINKQLGINTLIGFIVALLAILIYVLIKIFKQRKKANYLLNKKVLERSEELLQNQLSLTFAIERRDLALAKLSMDLNSAIESMKSLCTAGVNMKSDPSTQRYFEEINSTTSNLSMSLQSILPKSKMMRVSGS